jgi:hypothetical protein
MRQINKLVMQSYNLVGVQEVESKRSELSLILEKEELPEQFNEIYRLQRT